MIKNALIIASAVALFIILIAMEQKGEKIHPPAIPDWIWWAAG